MTRQKPTMAGMAVAALAAAKFKRSVFTDPITMAPTARRHGVLLNKQMYDARELVKGREFDSELFSRVPHSRRRLTDANWQRIYAIAKTPYTHREPVQMSRRVMRTARRQLAAMAPAQRDAEMARRRAELM